MENEKFNLSALLDERLEAQKARNELMKWKLIVISVIESAGFGFTENNCSLDLHLVIAIIPFACVYIDLLCRNLSIRTKRITYFLTTRSENNIDVEYAKFYYDVKEKTGQSLESFALFWSSFLISVLIIIIGIFNENALVSKYLFIASGSLCILLALFVERKYNSKMSYRISN